MLGKVLLDFRDHRVGALVAQRPLDDRDEVLELDGDAVVRAAAHEHDAGGELWSRPRASCVGSGALRTAVRNRLRGIRDVDLDVAGPQIQPVMAAGDQGMIAHMGVKAERALHPVADVAVVAAADIRPSCRP